MAAGKVKRETGAGDTHKYVIGHFEAGPVSFDALAPT